MKIFAQTTPQLQPKSPQRSPVKPSPALQVIFYPEIQLIYPILHRVIIQIDLILRRISWNPSIFIFPYPSC